MERCSLSHVQAADSLRAVYLVRGHREEVDSQLTHIDRDLAHHLYSVGVEHHAFLPSNLPYLGNGLDRPGLVVGEHNGHQDGLGPDSLKYPFRMHPAFKVNRKIGHLKPFFFERPTAVQYGRVLYCGGDDMAAIILERIGRTPYRQVVALGPTAGLSLIHI